MTSELNHPYYIYPGAPFGGGYTNMKLYNAELERLSRVMHSLLSPPKPTLLHITIGAAMEEYVTTRATNYEDFKWQWQQLFPVHLRDYLKSGKGVRHLIISPNRSFDPETYETPAFIKYTNDEYKWELHGDRQYYSTTYDCIVYIFCTMMPHIDSRNSSIVAKMESVYNKIKSTGETDIPFDPKLYQQTKYDVEFITHFYTNLKLLAQTYLDTGGFVTCFSFAVFNTMTDRGDLNKFIMFSEITSLLIDTKKCVLAEWVYVPTNYLMSSSLSKTDGISYADNTIAKHNSKKIMFRHNTMYLGETGYDPKFVDSLEDTLSGQSFFDVLEMIEHTTKYAQKKLLLECFYKINSLDESTRNTILLEKEWVNMCITKYGMTVDDVWKIYTILMTESKDTKESLILKYKLEILPHDMLYELQVCALVIGRSIKINIDSESIKSIFVSHPDTKCDTVLFDI